MAKGAKVDFGKMISDLRRKVKSIGNLEREPIVYYDILEDIDDSDSHIIALFVEPKLVEIFEELKEEFESETLSISVFKGIEKRFLREYLSELVKQKYTDVKVGEEISELKGSGYAVYLNWAGEGKMVVHRYANGKFPKKTCKQTPYWETENGVWIVSFKSCKDALDLCRDLNRFISENSERNFNIIVHRLCIDEEKECGGLR